LYTFFYFKIRGNVEKSVLFSIFFFFCIASIRFRTVFI